MDRRLMRRVKIPLLVLVAGLGGVVWEWWLTRPFGVGLSPDSATYLSVARALLQGKGWWTYQGAPLSAFPPLLPTLLALLSGVFRIDPLPLARAFQGVLWGMLVALQFALLRRFLPWVGALLLAGLLLVARPMGQVFTMLWSEPLFLVLFGGLFLLLVRYAESPNIRRFKQLTFVAALLPLTRYVGLVAVAWAAFWVGVLSPKSKRLPRLLLFTGGALLPLGLWLLRNLWLTGAPFGPRQPKPHLDWLIPYRRTLFQVMAWYLPKPLLLMRNFKLVGLGLTVLLTYLILRAFWTSWKPLFPVALFLSWNLVYFGALIMASAMIYFDLPNQRLLSPAFPALTAFLVTLLYALAQDAVHWFAFLRWNPKIVWVVAWVAGLALGVDVIWIQVPQLTDVLTPLWEGESAWGWQANPLLTYLRTSPEIHQQCDVIYSNAPWLVYLWGEFVPSRPLPAANEPLSWEAEATLPCFLWLQGASEEFIPIKTLAQSLPLRPLWQGEAGVIYQWVLERGP